MTPALRTAVAAAACATLGACGATPSAPGPCGADAAPGDPPCETDDPCSGADAGCDPDTDPAEASDPPRDTAAPPPCGPGTVDVAGRCLPLHEVADLLPPVSAQEPDEAPTPFVAQPGAPAVLTGVFDPGDPPDIDRFVVDALAGASVTVALLPEASVSPAVRLTAPGLDWARWSADTPGPATRTVVVPRDGPLVVEIAPRAHLDSPPSAPSAAEGAGWRAVVSVGPDVRPDAAPLTLPASRTASLRDTWRTPHRVLDVARPTFALVTPHTAGGWSVDVRAWSPDGRAQPAFPTEPVGPTPVRVDPAGTIVAVDWIDGVGAPGDAELDTTWASAPLLSPRPGTPDGHDVVHGLGPAWVGVDVPGPSMLVVALTGPTGPLEVFSHDTGLYAYGDRQPIEVGPRFFPTDDLVLARWTAPSGATARLDATSLPVRLLPPVRTSPADRADLVGPIAEGASEWWAVDVGALPASATLEVVATPDPGATLDVELQRKHRFATVDTASSAGPGLAATARHVVPAGEASWYMIGVTARGATRVRLEAVVR